MVGKLSIAGLRQRLQHVVSNETEEGYNPPRANNKMSPQTFLSPGGGQHIPFIASPLDPKTTEWLRSKHLNNNLTLKRRPTVAQTEAGRVAGGIFRKQHEASPLELFFDLFFVANLAVFTYNNYQVSRQSVGNYIGFFALLWSFWFHISIHDVRFYVDSILNRFLKLAQFIMFTGFTALGSVYGVFEEGGTTRAFYGLALLFMLSRIILMIQYGVVLWFVRPFKKTLVPLALMMLLYFCAAMGFLGTFLLDANRDEVDSVIGWRMVIGWYVIIGVEMLLAVTISSVWRILSFKRTHLVERIGLLTLIVMGEGIIGIMKSIAYVLDGTSLSIWDATGRVISGVFIIYLVFILYFAPISHERFGSVRQQFWVLLHFPLHIAIVLTEEGSAATLLWSTIMTAHYRLIDSLPPLLNPSSAVPNLSAFITTVNSTMSSTAGLYTYLKLKDNYNWYTDLDRLKNISSPYGSEVWNEQAGEILYGMINETTTFLFENFHFETSKKNSYITDGSLKLAAYYDSMQTVFTFFYTSAGVLLLMLGIMYWVGKNNKTWEEWIAIFSRLAVGLALPFTSIAAYNQGYETGFMFIQAGWIVPIVTWCYFAVFLVDNFVQNLYDRRYLKRSSSAGSLDPEKAGDPHHKRRYNGMFGPQAHEDSHTDAPTDHAGHTESESVAKGVHFQTRSHSGTGGESDSIHSGEATLNGRRESEQVPTIKTYSPPSSNTTTQPSIPRKAIHSERDWAVQPTYHMPPRSTSGYGRIDTEYRGYDENEEHELNDRGRMLDVDVEHGAGFEDQFRNDPSFERERMIDSPVATRGGDFGSGTGGRAR